MTLYDISPFAQSVKKYSVALAIGIGTGLFMSYCTSDTKHKQTEASQLEELRIMHEYFPDRQPSQTQMQIMQTPARTHQDERLTVFESYIRK